MTKSHKGSIKDVWQDPNGKMIKPEFHQIFIKFNPIVPNVSFLYSLKTSENGFLFSEGKERVHWKQMG